MRLRIKRRKGGERVENALREMIRCEHVCLCVKRSVRGKDGQTEGRRRKIDV